MQKRDGILTPRPTKLLHSSLTSLYLKAAALMARMSLLVTQFQLQNGCTANLEVAIYLS